MLVKKKDFVQQNKILNKKYLGRKKLSFFTNKDFDQKLNKV